MSKIKIAKALIDATGKPDASYACVQALEEDERERKADNDKFIEKLEKNNDKLITQMRQDNKTFIEQHNKDNAKFIDIVERELQLQHQQLELQNKQLRFLSWAIPVATGILALLIIVFGAIN